ncbi:aminotransferase class I/II-fold pyridoxal phosphate-dependent enzyme [Affinibrenneria salicis]|uniref:Aminotransferase class I/II-fold pyridoxal phosphate-dependent enzyme n=1 Tax=Affinibrenneria salicis TaxID=2590031 RepID=A0A5J5G1T1_9GAMM|nr:aminotransferase class I/II-fold pyridoxal phosphate-dependent enzyme [Affinibrenneria salicis]KAA9000621.1 aminotransferase class I/II-fold pyridoxal phosphate-dependent enzyme [Affinibrenneria salicis]
MTFPDEFRLISYLMRREGQARYPLVASYPQSMTIGQLLSLTDDPQGERLLSLTLDYPPLRGSSWLLAAIARHYQRINDRQIVSFAGADEAIYALYHVLLQPDDHVVVVTPCYQSLESVPLSLCQVSGVALDAARDWALDLDALSAALTPRTRMLVINFPHNPTGALIPLTTLRALVSLCRERGIWLVSDEVYRLTEYDETQRLPPVADLYERGISLNVMSKAYGLPGLRIGWIACQDADLLRRLERAKQYLSVCSAMSSEYLATQALDHQTQIIERVMRLARHNLRLLEQLLERYPQWFDWRRPAAGVLAFPRYLGPDGADAFAARLLGETGVLVIPSTIYHSALTPVAPDHLRIGFGRQDLEQPLAVLDRWLAAQ